MMPKNQKIRVKYEKTDRKKSKMSTKNESTIENYMVNAKDFEKRRGIRWGY